MRSARKGSAAVALVVAVALLALVTTAAVMSSGRDSRVGLDRMDGLHAMMAAEAGLRMGLRELSQSSDADSDGAVGSIGSSTPKTVGSATVQVAKATSGSVITLTSTGRRNTAIKVLRASVTTGTASTLPTVYWALDKSKDVTPSIYNGSSWNGGSNSGDISRDPLWVVAKSCPIRDESIVLILDDKKDVKVNVRKSGAWGSWQTLCTDTASSSRRMIEVAYEQNSGDGLICYFSNSGNKIAYRTVLSGTVSSEGTLSMPSSDDVRWVSLVAKPSSDEILLVCMNKDKVLRTATWNGAGFGSWHTLDSDCESEHDECFAATYESTSGRALVVWARKGDDNPRYAFKTGTSWGSSSTMGSVGSMPMWIRLASDPNSNGVIMVCHNDDDEVWVARWPGTLLSSWSTPTEFSSDTGSSEGNTVDVAYEGNGTRALVAYRKNGTSQIKYRLWNGLSWGSEATAMSPSNYLDYIELVAKPDSQEIYIAARSEQYLDVAVWNGSSVGPKTQLTNNLSSTKSEKSYDLDVGAGSSSSGVSVSGISSP